MPRSSSALRPRCCPPSSKPPATTPSISPRRTCTGWTRAPTPARPRRSKLKALGVTHVLIGHSERRQYFNETDESVNLKLKAALAHHLVPIVCVGEQLAEREANQTAEVLERQTSIALEGIDPAIATPLIIAYEPVWAIGTGRTATPEIAGDAHKIIRAQIANSLSTELAASTRILYGGSVKPDNTPSLCALEDIDGALVGGASLDPASFAAIVANSAALI